MGEELMTARSDPSRRRILAAAGWSAPLVVMSAAAPLAAASTSGCAPATVSWTTTAGDPAIVDPADAVTLSAQQNLIAATITGMNFVGTPEGFVEYTLKAGTTPLTHFQFWVAANGVNGPADVSLDFRTPDFNSLTPLSLTMVPGSRSGGGVISTNASSVSVRGMLETVAQFDVTLPDTVTEVLLTLNVYAEEGLLGTISFPCP